MTRRYARPVESAKARLRADHRWHGPDGTQTRQSRTGLGFAVVAQDFRELLHADPPATDEQRAELIRMALDDFGAIPALDTRIVRAMLDDIDPRPMLTVVHGDGEAG